MAYDESNVKSLSSIEHIRQRPGMYIGRLGNGNHPDDGIYILLKEVIDNSIDEFMEGFGNRIIITEEGGRCSVRDYGRGIPLNKVIDCVSLINTGAKYDNEAFQYSVGLNGVGTKAVNALSSFFEVTSYRDGEYMHAEFNRGKLDKKKTQRGKTSESNGTYVSFIPDGDVSIFGQYTYNDDFIRERLWNYAYLNKGLTLDFNHKIIRSMGGLVDLVNKILGDGGLYPLISFKNKHMEFSFTHTNGYGETYKSYVNGQYTSDGGTHEAAFKEGMLKGINEFFHKSWNAPEIRDGIVATLSIKVMNPVFESQTKNKLGNTDVRGWIVTETKEAVVDALMKNRDIAKGLQEKIENNEKIHKEEAAVRNGAKEKAKKVSINIPKLKECRYHLNTTSHKEDGEKSMIFLTEGDSAAGTITKTRNSDYQAVFALRGKILNVQGKNRTEIYKNEELYNMMIALGIEDGIDNLRYGKVVIATDADVDGFHIRNLIMTYFFTYFEELISQERLYILETPLFRVRNKKENMYCYSENEKEDALKKIKGGEVTRFKGLGEISPHEFKDFIGDDIRLVPVTFESIGDIKKEMLFYMGDNTPERRDFIMENLINASD